MLWKLRNTSYILFVQACKFRTDNSLHIHVFKISQLEPILFIKRHLKLQGHRYLGILLLNLFSTSLLNLHLSNGGRVGVGDGDGGL